MEIKLRGLKQGEQALSVSEPVRHYELDAGQFIEDLKSKILIDIQGRNYYITITTETNLRFECDRCLESFVRPYEVETKLIYTEDAALDPEHLQEGLYFLSEGKDTADLTGDVRQNVLLNLPMKAVCNDSCKGLCRECGTNLNQAQCACSETKADPRWDALKKLQL